MKRIDELVPDESRPRFDLRGIPTQICLCGCKVWNLKVMFEDNQISMYFLDMFCSACGSPATAPTAEELDCE